MERVICFRGGFFIQHSHVQTILKQPIRTVVRTFLSMGFSLSFFTVTCSSYRMIFFYLCSTFVLLSAFVILKKNKIGQTYKMGGWLSYLWWGGDPDVVNPLSGLTRREVYAVQQSWAIVYADPVANGTELLKRLFITYPETKDFFKMVKKTSEEEYPHNPQFKAHVINLMSSLNMAVSNLNQPEIVAAMMNKLGESHGRRKIQQEHFHDLKNVIVKMFIEVLKLDNSTLAAWSKAVDFWYENIFETLGKTEDR